MTSPSLATPAATIAICSGVTRTSNWPMADCAVCGAFASSGKRLSATLVGTRRSFSPKPNACACSRSASSPSCSPSAPKAVLQEIRSASASVEVSPLHAEPPKLRRSLSVCGRSSSIGRRDLRLRRHLPGLQRRRGRDDLEGRAGRVGLADRAVEQRVVGGVVQRGVVLADVGRLERAEPRRVVRRAGSPSRAPRRCAGRARRRRRACPAAPRTPPAAPRGSSVSTTDAALRARDR